MNFGEYLKKLRKEKSISQRELAAQSGISNAEISRIETGGRQKIAPDVLRAIAPILDVAYEELLDKAGYLDESANFIAENLEAEAKFISILTPKLVIQGFSVIPTKREPAIGDFMAKKDSEEWHILFKYVPTRESNSRHFRDDKRAHEILWRTYGKLAIYNESHITKYTIATNNEKIYKVMLEYIPKLLNLSISIMLVDLEASKIVEEKKLT